MEKDEVLCWSDTDKIHRICRDDVQTYIPAQISASTKHQDYCVYLKKSLMLKTYP